MEAKDRIVKYDRTVCPAFWQGVIDAALRDQDEISFKAGEDQGYKKGRYDALEENTEAIKKAGIKEVVEWINHYINLPELPELRNDNFNEIFQPQWQAKLKSWGIKED